MNTLYITADGYVTINQNGDVVHDTTLYSPVIKRLFLIKEDTKIQYSVGLVDKILDAKPGDIVLELYSSFDNNNRFFIVKNKEWAEDIMQQEEALQKEKEKWASLQKLPNEDCKCAL